MSTPSALSLRIVPEASGFYLGATGLVHLLAVAAAWHNGLPLWLRIALLLTVTGSFAGLLLRYRQALRTPVIVMHSEADGWSLQTAANAPDRVNLLPSSVRSPWLSILNFRYRNGVRQSVLIPRDSVDLESYRKLQVLLEVLRYSRLNRNES